MVLSRPTASSPKNVGAVETNEMFPSTARRAANHATVSAAVAA